MICLWTDSEVFYPLQFYELILLQLPVLWIGSEIHCLAFCVRNWFSNLPTPILSNLLLSHIFFKLSDSEIYWFLFYELILKSSTLSCFMAWFWNHLSHVLWPDSETICLLFYDLILKPSVSCFMTWFWNHLSPVLWPDSETIFVSCFMTWFWNHLSPVLWTDSEIYPFMFYELILKSTLSCFMNWYSNLPFHVLWTDTEIF